MTTSINFPNLGIHLEHVGKSVTVFGFEIAFYGIVISLGMLLGVWLITKEAKRTGQNDDFYFYTLLFSIFIGVIGARIFYVVFSWDYYRQHLNEILQIRNGGLAIYGGIIFGVATACVCAKIKKVPILRVLDTAVLGLPLGQLMGRWGNFFNREAFGGYTDNLFAMQLPVDAVRQNEITQAMWDHVQVIDGVQYIQVHPTFLYESLWNLGVFCLLLWFRKRRHQEGQVFLLYLCGYALGRLWIEGLRTDQLLIPVLGIPVSQAISAGVLAACVLIFLYRHQKQRKNEA